MYSVRSLEDQYQKLIRGANYLGSIMLKYKGIDR